jgi:hypothetical protein
MKSFSTVMGLLKRVVKVVPFMLGILNLAAGLMLLLLGTRYLLSIFGLIDTPRPIWIGWFVDDLLGMGMSARSSQAVVWAMTILGASLVVASIDYVRIRYFGRGEARGFLGATEAHPQT